MLKTVVVGSVSVLLGITSQPSAREQVTATVALPSQPAAPASAPTDVQQLPRVGKSIQTGVFGSVRPVQPTADAAAASAAATDAALADATKALEQQVQSRTTDCTFALKMYEVDPNVDSRIRMGAPDGGRAKIRRILPPACLK